MKEKLTHNLDLKILALVFAVILWLIVVNIDDPVKSIQFTGVEVKILHAAELEKQGLCYEVLDGSDTVTVTVTGRRSVIEEISEENITATADMKDLTSMNTISIRVTSNKSGNELDNIKVSSENVKLNIEKLQKVSKRIVVETEGTPAEDYVLGSRTVDLNQVEVSGPESIVSTIDIAKATLNVENASSSVSASVPIHLYNEEGNMVESSRLNVSITNVNINQDILYSREVPLEFEFTGTPQEGYALADDVIADVDSVLICGRRNVVENVYRISVRGEALNVDGERVNKTVELDLDDYLPANVELADRSFNGRVKVTAIIRRETYTILAEDFSKVRMEGLPTGKEAEILDEGDYVRNGQLVVRLYGLSEKLGEVDEEALVINLDFDKYKTDNNLTEITNGVYTMTPEIDLPQGVRLEDCSVRVRVSDKAEE